jgi:hypothetical protein
VYLFSRQHHQFCDIYINRNDPDKAKPFVRRGRKAAGLHREDGRAAEDSSLVSSAFLCAERTIEKNGVGFEMPSLPSQWGNSGGKEVKEK